MQRRTLLAGLAGVALVGPAVAADPLSSSTASGPPVPAWKPSFDPPLDRVVDRMRYYTDGKSEFAVLRHGTCCILDAGLTDEAAGHAANKVLSDILSFHPDMRPNQMDDGNLLVSYNHPAYNIVFGNLTPAQVAEVEARHLDGLVAHEVLITPLGPNKFNDVGKRALLGRAWMFLDALAPEIVSIHRR